MRDDLVKRLRLLPAWNGHGDQSRLPNEAADEIERLRARVAKLEEALKPFAERADRYDPVEEDDHIQDWDTSAPSIKLGDLRRARAALEDKG